MSVIDSFVPIAIVGGGPAGLTLARILQLNHVQCVVYEQEPAATARNQGGSLDLHQENGLWAIEQCGLIEEFNKHSRPEGDSMRIMNKTGQVLYQDEPPPAVNEQAPNHVPNGRPEVDRLALRNLLLDSLEPGTVQWGHSLAAIVPLPSAADKVPRWELSFKNGTTAQATLVIGADGAWSRIRPLLSSVAPKYTGITLIDFTMPQASVRHNRLNELVGQGNASLLDECRGIIAQMNGNDTLRTYAVLKVPEGWSDDKNGGAFLADVNRKAIDTLIARYFEGWHEPALDLMRKADMQSVAVRRLYALPFDHSFAHAEQARLVTAVGDAAHLMNPTGEGVNLAMIDAVQLALALAGVLSQNNPSLTAAVLVDQLATAIEVFERGMFDRSKAEADAPFNFDLFVSEDAAAKFANRMKQLTSKSM